MLAVCARLHKLVAQNHISNLGVNAIVLNAKETCESLVGAWAYGGK